MKNFLIAAFVTALSLGSAFPAYADLTLSNLKKESAGSEVKVYGTIAFDSSYPTGGETLNLALLPLTRVSNVLIETNTGYVFSYDYTNNKILVYQAPAATFTGSAVDVAQTVTVTHDGTPDGNDVYLQIGANGPHLASNMATDAESKVVQFSGGALLGVAHDVSASTLEGAVQVYFDSDGTGDSRLLAATTGGGPAYIPMSDGLVLGIANDVSASSNGSALKYDDGSDERFEANNSTAADATISSTARTWASAAAAGAITAAGLSEIPNLTSLAALTSVKFVAYGK